MTIIAGFVVTMFKICTARPVTTAPLSMFPADNLPE